MKKPIIEILQEELPAEIFDKAVKNSLDHYEEHGLNKGERMIDIQTASSLGDALIGAFVFVDSPEGYEYWNKVQHHIFD